MTAFGKSCIDLGSDLNEVQNVVDVTFKKMSGDMDKWAKGAAKNYGLSETMAKKYAGLYGSMAEAFGFSEKAAYEMSTTLTGLAGDVASFYNIDQDAAYTKLKAVFSGETEALKDLGIVMTQSALDNFALQQGMGKTVAQMSSAERVSLRYRFILDQLKNATGDFARTSNGWANQVRILKLNFDSLKASIGQGLIRAVSPALKVVNNVIGRVQVLADSFNNMIGSVFGTDADAANAVNSTAVAEQELADSANQSAAAVDGVTDSINKSAKAAEGSLASFDKLNLLSFNKPDEDSDAASSADTGTTAAVTGGFSKQMDKVADKISERWKKRSEKLVSSVKQTLDKIKTAVKKVGTSWRDVWRNGTGDKILDNTASLLSNIFGIIGDVAGAFTKAWDNAGKGDAVVQAIYDKWNSLISLLDTIAADFREVWNDGTGERIWGNILTIIQNCNRYTATWREKIKKAWEHNENGKRIWETILGIVEDVTGFFAELSEMRLEWLEDLDLDPIVGSVADLGEAFRELLKACGDRFKEVYKEVFLPLAKWTIEKGAPALLKTLANVMKFFSGVIRKIPKSLLKGIASGILAVVAASKAAKVISRVTGWIKGLKAAKSAGGWISVLQKAFAKLKLNPYAVAIGAVVTAIVAIVSAIKSFNSAKVETHDKQWDKEKDAIDRANEKLDNFTQNLENAAESSSKEKLEMKVDFEQIDKARDNLKKIIEDGLITEEEKAEFSKAIDLLKNNVDGFQEEWDKVNLTEIDGKIIIDPPSEDFSKTLDKMTKEWKNAKAKILYSDIVSDLTKSLRDNNTSLENYENQAAEIQKRIENRFVKLQENRDLFGNTGLHNLLYQYFSSKGNDWLSSQRLANQYEDTGMWRGLQKDLAEYDDTLGEMFEELENTTLGINNFSSAQGKLRRDLDGTKKALDAVYGSNESYYGVVQLVRDGIISESEAVERFKDKGIKSYVDLQNAAAQEVSGLKTTSKKVSTEYEKIEGSAVKAKGTIKQSSVEAHTAVNRNGEKIRNDIAKVGKSTGAASAEFKTGTDKISGHLATLVQDFRDKLGGLPSEGISWGRAVLENFKQGIMEKEGSVFDKVAEFVSGISSRLNMELNVTGGATAGLTIGLSAINAIPMATGRVVKAPTLAVVGDNPGAGSGDPEVVAPLSKLKTMMAGTGAGPADNSETNSYLKRIYEMLYLMSKNGGGSYQFIAEMNGSTLFKEMVRQNDLYKKRFGHSAF